MDCNTVREAFSSALDGEPGAVAPELVEAHLTSCTACLDWHTSATAFHRRLRVAPAEEIPDLTPAVLAAIGRDADRANGIRGCRVVLAACAAVQLLATLPVFLGTAGGPVHLDHELGAWDVALAVGLLVAAADPVRAWGMFPLVGAIAVTMTLTGITDVASGHTSFGNESAHLVELVGVFFLWSLTRLQTRKGEV